MAKNRLSVSLISVAVLAAGLSACVSKEGTLPQMGLGYCPNNTAEHLGGVDWSKAGAIDITYHDGAYTPLMSKLEAGKPYILRIANKDSHPRWFNANDFFNSVAVGKVVNGGRQSAYTCLHGVDIAPNSNAEISLVAVDKGGYYFRDEGFLHGVPRYDSPAGSEAERKDKDTMFFMKDINVGSGNPERGFGIISVE